MQPDIASAPPARSSFVTVVAWIFIVLGGFATLITLLQNVMLNAMLAAHDDQLPPEAAAQMPAFAAFAFAHMRELFFVFFVLCAATFAAALGLLGRRNWGRIAFIAIMLLGIAWNIGGLVAQHFMFAAFTQLPMQDAPPEMAADFNRIFLVMRIVSAVFALGFSALFGWIAWRLTTPEIRAEFR